jgi:hypothetical protein
VDLLDNVRCTIRKVTRLEFTSKGSWASLVKTRNRTMYLDLSFLIFLFYSSDYLCDLVVRVPGYKFKGPGLDARRYQIFI